MEKIKHPEKVIAQGREVLFRHCDGTLLAGRIHTFDMTLLYYEVHWQDNQGTIWKSYVRHSNILAVN